jgi:tetratricopeptide (TPR) repeat protein
MIGTIEHLRDLGDDEDFITTVEAALKLASTLKPWPLSISPSQLIGSLLGDLGNAYPRRRKGEPADNIERAIKAYEAALTVRTRDAFPQEWAQTQNNLGAAYRKRIRGESADNIEQAIKAYKAALTVLTRDAFPEKWALTQNDLGIAYRTRIRGESADNIEQAIKAYLYRESGFVRWP